MEFLTEFVAHDSYVLDLVFTNDNGRLISAGMDNAIKVWQVPDWKEERSFSQHAKSVNSIALSPDNQLLVSGSTDNQTMLYRLPDGELLHTLTDRKKVVAGVAFAPDGQSVAQVSYSGRLMVWGIDGEPIVEVKVQKKNLGSVTYSPDGKWLAVSGLGPDIWIYAFPSGEKVTTLTGHQIAVGSLRFLQNGKMLCSLGYEQTIKLWDSQTWETVRSILTPPGTRAVKISPDEKTAVFLREGELQLWDLPQWSERHIFKTQPKSLSGVAFSPDGRWLAVGAADKKIRIWKS